MLFMHVAKFIPFLLYFKYLFCSEVWISQRENFRFTGAPEAIARIYQTSAKTCAQFCVKNEDCNCLSFHTDLQECVLRRCDVINDEVMVPRTGSVAMYTSKYACPLSCSPVS